MGQHTWFVKNKHLYLKQEALYHKLDDHENGEIYLDDMERFQIEHEIDSIDELNEAEFHDVFRTSKRNADKTYIEEIIASRDECMIWINRQENKVTFENEDKRRHAIKRLNEFWDKYPNGLIYFS